MTSRHKVFISYHHGSSELPGDQRWKEKLEQTAGFSFISRAVDMGDISPDLKTDTIRQKIRDEYLRDSTVTIVLIGQHTWKRKHVDWEISMSIRQTEYNSRSGLVGLILPTHPFYEACRQGHRLDHHHPGSGVRYYQMIPPRLYDNMMCGYAKRYFWPRNDRFSPIDMATLIQIAYDRRLKEPAPRNKRPSFGKNKDNSAAGWQ